MIPTDIAGLKMWMKVEAGLMKIWSGQVGSLGVPINGYGDYIGSWTDSSGAGNHFTDAMQVSPTRFDLAGIDGHNSLLCYGGFQIAPVMNIGAFTLFIVFKATQNYLYFENTYSNYIYLPGGAHASILGSGGQSAFDVNFNFIDGVWRTIVQRFDGTHAGHILRTGGTDLAKTTVYNSANPGTTPRALSLAYGAIINGNVAEIIMYDSSLSIPNIKAVEGYLNQRFFGLYSSGGGTIKRIGDGGGRLG